MLLFLLVFALVGKTAVTSFAPELTYTVVVASDWTEESEEEDELGDDDKVFESVGGLLAVPVSLKVRPIPVSLRLETLPRTTPKPPPQA